MKTLIELREEAIEEDKNPEFFLYQKLEESEKEVGRLTAESTEWESKFYDLQEEIENLKNRIHDLLKDDTEYKLENERLYKSLEEQRHFYLKELEKKDNIINELEDYMIGKDIYKILLYKLRDLKDSDEE